MWKHSPLSVRDGVRRSAAPADPEDSTLLEVGLLWALTDNFDWFIAGTAAGVVWPESQ